MLQYLVVILDDTSVSFCHHDNLKSERYPMPIDVLKECIKFAMKWDLRIQFVLPNYPLPVDYWHEMFSVDHVIIAPGSTSYEDLVPKNVFYQKPDVVVFDSVADLFDSQTLSKSSAVLRVDKKSLFSNQKIIFNCLTSHTRLNIIITDVQTFKESDFRQYQKFLSHLSESVKNAYLNGLTPQVNLLTDRMMLKEMNNCNAGVSCIALAPDGNFYICPAFYFDNSATPIRESFAIGSLKDGMNIKNSHLYKIEYAPLCRICDAYQCKRCVWLNNNTTYEFNTPSHEQCVISHLERNASRKLLSELRAISPSFMEGVNINEIDYLDPFTVKPNL